jgi:hypothetical protein
MAQERLAAAPNRISTETLQRDIPIPLTLGERNALGYISNHLRNEGLESFVTGVFVYTEAGKVFSGVNISTDPNIPKIKYTTKKIEKQVVGVVINPAEPGLDSPAQVESSFDIARYRYASATGRDLGGDVYHLPMVYGEEVIYTAERLKTVFSAHPGLKNLRRLDEIPELAEEAA